MNSKCLSSVEAADFLSPIKRPHDPENEDKAFIRADNGDPVITHEAAYHLENARLIDYLEAQVESSGATIVDTRIDQGRGLAVA